MTKEYAMNFLMNLGWNENGADAIVEQLIEDEMLEEMTDDSLKSLSGDYIDR